MSILNCPQCGQLDKVQKVSALFSQGTQHTSYETPSAAVQIKDTTFYGTQERNAISRTALSQKLMPPSKPDIQKPKKNLWVTKSEGYIGASISFVIGIGLAIGGIYVSVIVNDINSLWKWCGTIGFLLIIVVPITTIKQFIDVAKGKESKEHYEVEMNWYNERISEYEHAQSRWDSAYYCGRCDGVFSLGSTKLTPINEFYKFLSKYD